MSETLYKILAFSGSGSGPQPKPEPILPPDLPWVRPDTYPDLESIVLDSSNPEIEMYFTCDKAFIETTSMVRFYNMAGATITAGHIENNQFVGDYPPVQGQEYATIGYSLADINEDIFVIKVVAPSAFSGATRSNENDSRVIREAFVRLNNPTKMFFMNDMQNIKHIKYDIFNSQITDMGQAFAGCWRLQSIDLSNFDTTNCKKMNQMFQNCHSLQSLDLSLFDTSKVTTMEQMFRNCYSLQSINLSSFRTSAVINMNYMFGYCTSLLSLDLSSFDTSNVTGMDSMFYYCNSLQSLDLSSFDTTNTTNINQMFYYCTALAVVKFPTIWKGLSMSDRLYGYSFYRSSYLEFVNALTPTETSITYQFHSGVQHRLTAEDIAIAQNKGYTITFR